MAINKTLAPAVPAGPQRPRTADSAPIAAPIAIRQTKISDWRTAPRSASNSPPFGPRVLPGTPPPFGFCARRGPSSCPERPVYGSFSPPAEPVWPDVVLVGADRFVRLACAIAYENMPPCELSAEQRERVGEFDLSLEGRGLDLLHHPVAIFSGRVAHVYEYDTLMRWWQKNQTHPHTNQKIEACEFYRVVPSLVEELCRHEA